MFDNWESIVAVVVAILIAYGVVLWLGTLVWTYRDIRSRTQDGWTQAVSLLLVVVFNLPGLFLYLVLRPQETLNEAYERRLEAEALMRDMPEPQPSCPNCRRRVNSDFLVCPNCRTGLRQPCESCSQPLDLGWTACPYCAAPGPKGEAASATDGSAETPQPPAPPAITTAAAAPRATQLQRPTPSAPNRESSG